MKRLALGVVLLALGLSPLASAQTIPSGGMLGPNAPILVDLTGDGPSVGDDEIIPTRSGSVLTIPNQWEQCGTNDTHNVFNLNATNFGSTSMYTGANRIRSGQTETASITDLTGNRPTEFSMLVDKNVGTDETGQLDVVDSNGDGIYDTLVGSGGQTFSLGIQLEDGDNDGDDDHATVPWWTQAAAWGIDGAPACNPYANATPAIWVPLADTNGDGAPDSIVLDLDGNGVADPQFFASPIIAGASHSATIPTLSEWGAILAALALAGVAWLQIRSRGI